MAKYYGNIGFSTQRESKPGVWVNEIVEKKYFGDLIKNTKGYQSSDSLNDDIRISNEISIVADPYANEHYSDICYVELNGAKWKVTNINIQYPRLVLSIGGVYNG